MEKALYNDLEVIALNEIPGALYFKISRRYHEYY